VKFRIALAILILSGWCGRAAEVPDIATFQIVTAGQYQVLAQSGRDRAWQVNRFMNEMLKQYGRYFSNWSLKDGARVIVFDNLADFRAYSADAVGMTHASLAGYCHWKTDEDGNSFYELVTYESEELWQVLAHEGFHQFLGYELGPVVPIWLNEGLAQYFETSYIANGRLHTGGIPEIKLQVAQYLMRSRKAPALSELLTMDRATFYADGQVNYPMGWALVYYLLNRDAASFKNSQFRRYLQDLKMNSDSVSAFRRRFGRDSAQWQKDFEQYILRLHASGS
jgi:hypothetical protein